MKKFTYTLTALAVAFSINTYAEEEEFTIEDDASEEEMITEHTDPSFNSTIGLNITDEEIASTGKQLFTNTAPPAQDPPSSPIIDNTDESEIESEDPIREEDRITENTPPEDTIHLPSNIPDTTIASEGVPLVVDNIETNDPTPIEDRVTKDTPAEESNKIQPNISDEELDRARKESGAEFYRETRQADGSITPIDRPALVNPPPKKSYEELNAEKAADEKEEEKALADLASGESVIDPEPEHGKTPPPKTEKEQLDDPSKQMAAHHATESVDTKPFVNLVNSVASTINANLALSSIGSRLTNSRHNDNQTHTASLNTLLPFEHKQSGLWVSTKYGKTQRTDVFKSQHWGMQIGFDHPFKTMDATIKLGVATDLEKGKSTITTDRLRSDIYGIALYGAYETLEHHFIDFFARSAYAKNKLTGATPFRTLQHTAAIAYSTLIEASNAWSFEPKAQLIYAHLNSHNFTKDHVPVYIKPTDSFTGQLGLKANFNLNKQFSTYGKAEFNQELSNRKAGSVGNTTFMENKKAHWTTVGLGMKSQLNTNTNLFFDIETQLGNAYRRTYQLNLGVNVKF